MKIREITKRAEASRKGAVSFVTNLSDYFSQHPYLDKIVRFSEFYRHVQNAEVLARKRGWAYASQKTLDAVGINLVVEGEGNIPQESPNLYFGNHPWGMLEGLAIMSALEKPTNLRGRNFKIVANYLLEGIKGLDQKMIFIHPGRKVSLNFSGFKNLIAHVKQENDLVVLPAGSACSWNWSKFRMEDPNWKENFAGILPYFENAVPIRFSGPRNGILYTLTSIIHAPSRGGLFFRELCNKKGSIVKLTIGSPVKTCDLQGTRAEKVKYLRSLSEAL